MRLGCPRDKMPQKRGQNGSATITMQLGIQGCSPPVLLFTEISQLCRKPSQNWEGMTQNEFQLLLPHCRAIHFDSIWTLIPFLHAKLPRRSFQVRSLCPPPLCRCHRPAPLLYAAACPPFPPENVTTWLRNAPAQKARNSPQQLFDFYLTQRRFRNL